MKTVKPIKPTLKEQYKKELRRLKRFIREAEKRGFSFPIGSIPEEPKRITSSSVTRLRRITPESLYRKATYTDADTNLRVKGKTPQQIHKMMHPGGNARKRGAPDLPTGRRPASEKVKKPPLTPEERKLRKEYSKQKSRIKRVMQRAAQRGYYFPDMADLFVKPDQATRAELEKLRGITANDIYGRGIWRNPATGEVISGSERRRQERSEAAQRGVQTRRYREALERLANQDKQYGFFAGGLAGDFSDDTYETLRYINNLIDQWSPSGDWNEWYTEQRRSYKNTLKSILDGAINREGREAVARRLQERAQEVIDLVERILFGSDKQEDVQFYLVEFATILKGSALTAEESYDLTEQVDELDSYD